MFNYILIVSDGWRADMALNPTLTPHLHNFWLKYGGWIFNNCYSPSTWTLPVQMSLYTGLLPSHHGVHDITFAHRRKLIHKNPYYFSPKGIDPEDMVMNRLKAKGYTTKYFTPDYHKDFLLETAHRYHDNIIPWDYFFMQVDKIKAESIEKPFFWMMYDMDGGHAPYGFVTRDKKEDLADAKLITDGIARKAPERFSHSFLRELLKQQTMQYDNKLASFLDWFVKTGLYKDTALFICADHGEAIWEHNWVGHVFNVYEELVKVPLFVYYPAILRNTPIAQPIGAPVSLVDITPTILSREMYGDGVNLFVREPRRLVFFEFTREADPDPENRVWENLPSKSTFIRGIRFGKYKFIYTKDMDGNIFEELYDFKYRYEESKDMQISSHGLREFFMKALREQFEGVE